MLDKYLSDASIQVQSSQQITRVVYSLLVEASCPPDISVQLTFDNNMFKMSKQLTV